VTDAPIEPYGRYYHGDPVRSSLVATRVFFVPFISLLFFGIVIWKLPALAVQKWGSGKLARQNGSRSLGGTKYAKPRNPLSGSLRGLW
jgi:hypothetical protein